MRNAKEEFLEQLKENSEKKLVCAYITYKKSWEKTINIVLQKDYTDEEYSQFLQKIDFLYDEGYGHQQVDGIIWFDDGTWLERDEYDGSEWWNLMSYPPIPEVCFKNE